MGRTDSLMWFTGDAGTATGLQRAFGGVRRRHAHACEKRRERCLRGECRWQMAAMHIVMGIIGGKAGVYRHHRNLFLFALLPAICILLASTTRSENNDTKVEREGDEALDKTICGDDG